MEPTLNVKLRDYLLTNKIPLAFINFEKSLFLEPRNHPKKFQILVLEKPNKVAFEVENLKWEYPANTALLVFNNVLDNITLIPLKFSFKLPDVDVGRETEFNFCNYQSLVVTEDCLLLAARGEMPDYTDYDCLDMALFTAQGKLISVWKTKVSGVHRYSLNNFYQLESGAGNEKSSRWIVNIKAEEAGYESDTYQLHLLSANETYTNIVYSGKRSAIFSNNLLDVGTSEIASWFSEEINGISHFFCFS